MNNLFWFLKRLIEKLREDGIKEAVKSLWWGMRQFKDRIAEREFDRSFQIDTCFQGKEDKEHPAALDKGHLWYDPSRPKDFFKIMKLLSQHCQDYTFIDLGSGKGRTLLMASHFPFKKILGVEYLQHYHEIACRNLTAYKNPDQKCFDLQNICGDAGEFSFPEGNQVVYLCNPFGLPILERMMENLNRLLKSNRWDVFIVYVNPMERAIFDKNPLLKIFHEQKSHDWYSRFVVYQFSNRNELNK